jgi:polysaccharide biosynthesis/export protein VpsN
MSSTRFSDGSLSPTDERSFEDLAGYSVETGRKRGPGAISTCPRARALGLRALLVAAQVWFVGGAFGCATRRATPAGPDTVAILAPEEKLGVGDLFEVRVVSEPELSGTFQVGSDGTIDYPFAGRLQVAGLGPGDVQKLITTKLQDGYLRSPQVSVHVKEWNSRKVAVLGQVARPGPVPYFPNMTIVDAIAAAGGFTPLAAKNSVKVRRESSGKTTTRTYAAGDISEGTSPNVVLLPGDIVVVDERLF